MSAKLSNNGFGEAVRVRTGRVRISYPHLFEKDSMSGKYSVKLLIPKDDNETMDAIRQAIENAKESGKDRLWGGKIPSKLRMILHDGDESEKEEDKGFYTLNANNSSRIDVLGKGGTLIDDPDDLYPGCYVQAIIEFMPYTTQGNGIKAKLEGIKKVADGERLGGSGYKAGADDFDDDGDEDDDLI